MDKWKIRTKIEVGFGIIVVLMLLSVAIIPALTRTITSSSDNMETFIRNSNGNYWAATGANLQTAIWDLNSTGGTVWLPVGTIEFSTTRTGGDGYSTSIILESNICLKGSGRDTTILKLANSANSNRFITCYGIKNFSISDLSFDGNLAGVTDSYCILKLDKTEKFTVSNIHIYHPKRNGINIKSSYYALGTLDTIFIDDVDDIPNSQQSISCDNISHINFKNIFIDGNGVDGPLTYGMDFNGVNHCIFNNIIINNTGEMLKFDVDVYSHNNTFNNIVGTNLYATATPAIVLDGLDNSTFTDMNIQCKYRGIDIGTTSRNLIFSDIQIANCSATGAGIYNEGTKCMFDNILINSYGVGKGIYGSGINCTYSNIIIQNTGGIGIDLRSGVNSNNCSFSNIIVLNSGTYGISMGGTSGMIFLNCKVYNSRSAGIITDAAHDFIISNSIISSSDSFGIDYRNSYNFIVEGCIFLSNVGDGMDSTSGASNNYTISNCVFKGNPKSIDAKSTDNFFIISECICDSAGEIDINAARSTTRMVNDSICTLVTS